MESFGTSFVMSLLSMKTLVAVLSVFCMVFYMKYSSQSYYEVLKVNKYATKTEIIRAFEDLEMKYRGDENMNSEEFQDIEYAFWALKDDNRRNIYDIYGAERLHSYHINIDNVGFYYAVLGVKKNASKTELSKALRTFEIKYHSQDRREREIISVIREAYSVLQDDNRRIVYDINGDKGLKIYQSNINSNGFHYAVLGVEKNAVQEEISTAFEKLERKYLSDENEDRRAQELLTKVETAYEVLGNYERKIIYDIYGDQLFGICSKFLESAGYYYAVLCVPRHAMKEEIGRQFLNNKMKFDTNKKTDPNSNRLFDIILKANHVLGNYQRRLIYDIHGDELFEICSTFLEPTEYYYAVLCVPRYATKEEIGRQFQNIERKFDPNKKKGPYFNRLFDIILKANHVLGNCQRRLIYDIHGDELFETCSTFLEPTEYYYAVLCVSRYATKEDKKRQFQNMKKKFDPNKKKDPYSNRLFDTILKAAQSLGIDENARKEIKRLDSDEGTGWLEQAKILGGHLKNVYDMIPSDFYSTLFTIAGRVLSYLPKVLLIA